MKTIWGKGLQKEKNRSLAFVLSEKVTTDKLYLSLVAINVYRLFINGKLVGYGPARACHGYVRKDIYDISSFAENGELIIVAEVFGSNVNSYYLVDEPPFFGAEIRTGNGTDLFSTENGDFKAYLLSDRTVKVQRYCFQRPFVECYDMVKSRSFFYNGDFSIFPRVDMEFVECNKIIERYAPYPLLGSTGDADLIEQGMFVIDQDLPKWEDRSLHTNDKLRGFARSELEVCLSDDASAFSYKMDPGTETGAAKPDLSAGGILSDLSYSLYDFKRTITGFLNVKLKAARDTTLYILWDEIDWFENIKDGRLEKNICFYRNSCCNVIKYTVKAGDYDLLSFEPTSARYAKIAVVSGEIAIEGFSMVTYENPSVFALGFISEDPKLNAIVRAAQNTLAQNAVDVLTDCPSRERAGWLCDAYFSAKAEKLMTGSNKIEKSLIENYVLAPQLRELPEGMLPMCYPCDHYDGNYIPNWAMWFVAELKEYLDRTGDSSLVEQSRKKIYKLIDFYDKFINTDGLLENLEGWVFVEWSKCNDPEFIKGVNYPSNMMFSMMLKAIGELYKDDSLIVRAGKVKDKIIGQSFNGEFFEENRIRENSGLVLKSHVTETCQYYAFFCGIASKETYPELFALMVGKFGPYRDHEKVYPAVHKSNAFIGNYLRLEVLMKYHLKQQILDECKEFFNFMAIRTGTLWEHSYPYGSLDHGFTSVAANYIIECTTGLVDIDFDKKIVKMTEPLKQYKTKATIPTPDGNVVISSDCGEVKIDAPKGYAITKG